MQGEATPNYPAAHDNLVALVTFVKDAKACAVWLKDAGETIQRNEMLLETIGKANQIDKLHAEAAELKEKVLSAIELREQELTDDREAFKIEMKDKRAANETERNTKEKKLNAALSEANNANARAKANEEATSSTLKNARDHEAKAQKIRDNVTGLQVALRDQQKAAKALAEQLGV